jgi:hypothetical protein
LLGCTPFKKKSESGIATPKGDTLIVRRLRDATADHSARHGREKKNIPPDG